MCSSDVTSSLLAEDVVGSYLLCPYTNKNSFGSLVVRFPSGLITLVIKISKGTFSLEVSQVLFDQTHLLTLQYKRQCVMVNGIKPVHLHQRWSDVYSNTHDFYKEN